MPRDEYCPIYHSLDLFGDRWGLLVVREMLRGVTRKRQRLDGGTTQWVNL